MSKKCPPGVICLENMTMIFIIIFAIIAIYIGYGYSNTNKRTNYHNHHVEREIVTPSVNGFGFFARPNFPYNNMPQGPGDVLLDPYVPPLSDDRYMVPDFRQMRPPGTIPINISTNVGAVDTNYRQMGLLTPLNKSGKILPLMGRPLFTNRNKWQYYSMSDQNNSVKLPIIRNGRSCTNEYGCDELYSSDVVYVEGYNQAFKTTIYDNDTIKYIPFL